MNITQLAKQLTQTQDRKIIETLQLLVFLMKKFGKSLNTPAVLQVIDNHYPKVVSLYKILGASRCSISKCQQLLVAVSRLLDYNHLDVVTSSSFDKNFSSEVLTDIADSSVVGLSVTGKGKIYKRSLESDLQRLISN